MNKSESYQDVPLSEPERLAFLERVRRVVTPDDYQRIEAQTRALPALISHIAQKDMSIRRLRQMVFGARTEKTAAVCPPPPADPGAQAVTPKPKRKGHGRRGAATHTGARQVKVPHPSLQVGDPCPACITGKLRSVPPTLVVRVYAVTPLSANVYNLEKLRCNLCGATFTAPTPAEAGTHKYAPNVAPMLAILRYGTGVPHYRLERFQQSLGVPLPASTQWGLLDESARLAAPVWDELVFQAAQAELFHNDDTTMRVAALRQRIKAELDPQRTGIFTSSILAVSARGDHPIALFFTGGKHAGENLDRVLSQRCAALPDPLQMCDALTRNLPKNARTLEGNCLAHGRRKVVEVVVSFPEQSRHLLETLREVYLWDAKARTEQLSPEARLLLHQTHSRPLLEQLHVWLREQFTEKKAEPNSGIGQTISYFLNHWEPLTLFLRHAGAPLDNNICEQALKMAIMHRKNSLGYKTERGAEVGDLFMSLIHTCRLNGVNPFEYLTALASNSREVAANPEAWLPWNYPKPLPATDTG